MTLIALYIFLTALYNLRHMPRLPSGEALPAEKPLVSVLIPARNEARNIGACLESLVAQDYPNLEILVLDDDSSDETASIVQEIAARHAQVRLIRGRPLPPEWHGKAWACYQLGQEAQGEWLLFADADTRHQPNAISSAVALASARGFDLVSLLPDMGLKTFGLRVIMAIIPFVFMACVPYWLFTESRSPNLVAALGPFMLFRKKVYQAFGGHEAVRRDIVDDVFIARWVKRVGGRVALVEGVSVLRVEFYQSFAEAWHGLAKSAFAAFDYSLIGFVLAIAVLGTALLGPYVAVYGALRLGWLDWAHLGLPLVQILLVCGAMGVIHERFSVPKRYGLLIALTVTVAILFAMDSVAHSLFGPGTVWKGRAYQFRGR